MDADRWNHNIHHLPVVLAAVPHGAERALDIGCARASSPASCDRWWAT